MATLADELLNDFEDSGSEVGLDDVQLKDQDEGDGDDGATSILPENVDEGDNDEEGQEQIEKTQFKGVADVRSVARLMETLRPILEVSIMTLMLYRRHILNAGD